jgi:hypothetical protein
MRAWIISLVAAALAGCATSKGDAHNGKTPDTQTATAVATKPCAMQSGGRDVLHLTIPADAPTTPGDGTLTVMSRDGYVEFWLTDAHTVDEAAARAGQIIVSEFKDLKVTTTTDLSVAGSPAKRLGGTGVEADDGDPGMADVVVFKAGGRVFVACTHGESMRKSAQRLMMDMVQSAKAP